MRGGQTASHGSGQRLRRHQMHHTHDVTHVRVSRSEALERYGQTIGAEHGWAVAPPISERWSCPSNSQRCWGSNPPARTQNATHPDVVSTDSPCEGGTMKYEITYRVTTYKVHECEADSYSQARALLEHSNSEPVCEWTEVTQTAVTESR